MYGFYDEKRITIFSIHANTASDAAVSSDFDGLLINSNSVLALVMLLEPTAMIAEMVVMAMMISTTVSEVVTVHCGSE